MGSSASKRPSARPAAGNQASDEGEEDRLGAPAASPSLMEQAVSGGVTQGYEELVNAIIRPPRMQYDPGADLGPANFRHCGKRFRREDFELRNNRSLKLQCSWWKFQPEDAPAKQLPCVIYLHGNGACRIAAFQLLPHLLPSSVTVFSLDFAGSGLSEGEHVSLGHFEREDVEVAIAHLRDSGEVSTIGLWGHSMGATTALLYGDRDPSIGAMVLDSPFADLPQLANELAQNARENGLRVPGFAISVATSMVRRSVRLRAGFDMRDVSPIANCGKCFIPALFAHGERDAFIKPSHSEQLHGAYAGDKNLILFDGDHNSPRPSFFFSSAAIFLRQTLMVQDEHCLHTSTGDDAFRPGAGLFDGGAASIKQAEDEMICQAMMLSIAEAAETNGGSAPPRQAISVPAAAPQSDAPNLDAKCLQDGAENFLAVTGVGGQTAEFYVFAALCNGETVDAAVQRYFDNDCEGPPPGWRLPVAMGTESRSVNI
eukprot:TRINITY_DN68479_c0_g1_i1.p1 TRINITY_DN68479_c0_g1~~TRINITY_DN68479_c0_g1_i1.p1  ORF type:complete len:485 (-),score=84.97 TRINITY_DN68479_c0_g1_i1:170-1624(-)